MNAIGNGPPAALAAAFVELGVSGQAGALSEGCIGRGEDQQPMEPFSFDAAALKFRNVVDLEATGSFPGPVRIDALRAVREAFAGPTA